MATKPAGDLVEQLGRPTRLSVIVPAYNEASTLRQSLDRLLKVDLPLELEVIVVDDGSTDGCIATIDDLVDGRRVKVVLHERNLGKGAALLTGFEHATGEFATIHDADLEYDPNDLKIMLEPVMAGEASVVYGTRSFGAHTAFSFWYVIGNKFISFWASMIFNSWLSDIATCYKLAPLEVWRSLRLRGKGFELEPEATGKLLRRGFRIYEVPIKYNARTREEGKKLHWRDGVMAIWVLLRVRFSRP